MKLRIVLAIIGIAALAIVPTANATSDGDWDIATGTSGSASLAATAIGPNYVVGQINCRGHYHNPDASNTAFYSYTTCDGNMASLAGQAYILDNHLNVVGTGNPTQCPNCSSLPHSSGTATLTAGSFYAHKYVTTWVLPPMFTWTSYPSNLCTVQNNFQTLNCTWYAFFTA